MIKNDITGRILGIIFGLILMFFYHNTCVKLIGFLEFISCIFLHIFYRTKRFSFTKILVLLIFVPLLTYNKAYLPAILLFLWDSLSLYHEYLF